MMPILLNFERIVDGGTSNNFIIVIIDSFVVFGGMLEIDLINKVVCFVVDNVTIF
jgi:hypothetical protein